MPRIEEMLGISQENLTPKKRNIYLASSWRNLYQPGILTILRMAGHKVYDFRNPTPTYKGFSWGQIDANWHTWTPDQYRNALDHRIAREGFKYDIDALNECDTCILLLPSGRSASWEFGYACGKGKEGVVIMLEKCEPELMYLGNKILTTMEEIMEWAGIPN